MDRWIDRLTEGQTDGGTDGWTDRQMDGRMNRQKDKAGCRVVCTQSRSKHMIKSKQIVEQLPY